MNPSMIALRPEIPDTPWQDSPPLTASAGGINLALTVGRSQPRMRRRRWFHPTRMRQMFAGTLGGALFFGGLWALYTWG